MAPLKQRARHTAVARSGLGLFEILSRPGSRTEWGRDLPPGQRDAAGFWFPHGYGEPAEIVAALERPSLTRERRNPKRRVAGRGEPVPAGSEITVPLPAPVSDSVPPSGPPRRPDRRPRRATRARSQRAR